MADEHGVPLAEVLAACQGAYEQMTPGPWEAWQAGNSPTEDGVVHHQCEVKGLPRTYEPRWVGWERLANHFKTFMKQGDAEGIVTLVNAWPRLRAELERLPRVLHATQLTVAESAVWLAERDQLRVDLQRKEAALRALVADLDLRAECHALLHGESEVVVPVSASILNKARAALGGPDA